MYLQSRWGQHRHILLQFGYTSQRRWYVAAPGRVVAAMMIARWNSPRSPGPVGHHLDPAQKGDRCIVIKPPGFHHALAHPIRSGLSRFYRLHTDSIHPGSLWIIGWRGGRMLSPRPVPNWLSSVFTGRRSLGVNRNHVAMSNCGYRDT